MAGSPTKLRVVLGVAIAAACAIAAWGWLQVFQRDGWATGARRVAWLGADGSPVEGEGGSWVPGDAACFGGGDIHLSTLVVGGSVWTLCSPPRNAPPGLARIDVAEGVGRLAWPFPAALPSQWSVAVLPHPERPWLGYVYRARVEGRDPLAVAIAGPDGWLAPPVALPGGRFSRALGLAWVGERLEVALVPTTASDEYGTEAGAVVVAVTAGAAAAPREVPRDRLCEEPRICQILAAARPSPGEPWWFLVDSARPGEPGVARRVTEDGATREALEARAAHQVEIDPTAVGLLEIENSLARLRLTPDGHLEPREPSRAPKDMYLVGGHFRGDGGRIHREYQTRLTVDPTIATFRPYGDALAGLFYERRDAEHDELLLAGAGERVETVVPDRVVARTFSFSCGSLFGGTLVGRDGGGWWLVAPDGCYVALTDDLGRADPLGVVEHLLRRGSIGIEWHEPSHVVHLAWVLFGLPVALLLGAAVARLRRRKGARLATHLLAATALYALPGLWFATKLVEILR